MKLTILVLVALFSLNASATKEKSFLYKCFLLSDKEQKISFELNQKEMKLFDQYEVISVSPYKADRGYAILNNGGVVGGKGKMKDRLYFSVDYEKSQVVSETTSHFYLEQELVVGGKKMKNGSMGGFVTIEGHGYSYESYVCFLQK